VVLVDAQNPSVRDLRQRRFEALTGYPAAELLGRNLRFLQAEDREQDGRQRLREAMARGESCRVLLRNTARTARYFGTKFRAALFDGEGRITHFAGHHAMPRAAAHRSKLARDS